MGKYQVPVLLVALGASCPGGCLQCCQPSSPGRSGWAVPVTLSGCRVTSQTGGEVGHIGPPLLLQVM